MSNLLHNITSNILPSSTKQGTTTMRSNEVISNPEYTTASSGYMGNEKGLSEQTYIIKDETYT